MREPIETLPFDFGGTLDANGVAWKDRFYALYRAEGLDMAADAFESSFFAADDSLVGIWRPQPIFQERCRRWSPISKPNWGAAAPAPTKLASAMEGPTAIAVGA
jgi:hypothetical protein